MKGKLKNLRLATFLALASAALGIAQTTPTAQRPDSVQPGEVNYIEGQVMLNGASLQSNSALRSIVIQPGSTLSTGQGFAEVLLTPGTFLRIGNNSEIQLVSAGLISSNIKLTHGSALLEAADVVKGSTLNIGLGNSNARVAEKGLYAFNANQQAVKVLDGKLTLTTTAGQTTLKKGGQVLLASDQPLKKRDFDRKASEQDPLYVWSSVRSHDEAEASVNVAAQVANYGGWYGPGWYWDPAWSFYAFAPGWGYLGGPFGWNYYSPAFIYGYPYWGYRGRGYYGRGFVAGHGFRPGVGQFHSAATFHGMSGAGFHGGGGGHR
jgi:FecR protein